MSKIDKNISEIKECTYSVKGMHCASCEVLIEKKLLKKDNIEAIEASTSKNEVTFEYRDVKPSIDELNKLFMTEGYSFEEAKMEPGRKEWLVKFQNGQLIINNSQLSTYAFIVLGIIGIFLVYKLFERFGVASWVSVDVNSALPAFFLFGVIAGLSSCAALVGGIVLSMSKQWYDLHSASNSFSEKIQPHILFNIGRIASYFILGGVLGAIGSIVNISPLFMATIAILVAIMMILLGLQMLGIPAFQKFQFRVPKYISRYIADESNFAGRYMPMLMGALTFFLPCGFTITAQGLAIISGSPLKGALMMSLFALGTSPMLMFIGMSSTKLYEKALLAENFMKIIAILVIFFGLSTINMQMVALGLPSLGDIVSGQTIPTQNAKSNDSNKLQLPGIVDGKQILKMEASASKYTPEYLRVQVGIPVRWEITDIGTSGCTNAIISKGLFEGQIQLTKGEVSVKEFTPTKTGMYRFSCWMGMVKGVIEVVDGNSANSQIMEDLSDTGIVESGAKGCGCGGGNSCGAEN